MSKQIFQLKGITNNSLILITRSMLIICLLSKFMPADYKNKGIIDYAAPLNYM